jgi:hypothetical protein
MQFEGVTCTQTGENCSHWRTVKSPVSALKLWRGSQQKQLTFLLAHATDMAASCMRVSVTLIKKPTVEKMVMKRGHYLHHACQENTGLELMTSIHPLTTLRHQWYGWLQEFCITQKILPRCPKLLSTVKQNIKLPWGVYSLRNNLHSSGFRKCRLEKKI